MKFTNQLIMLCMALFLLSACNQGKEINPTKSAAVIKILSNQVLTNCTAPFRNEQEELLAYQIKEECAIPAIDGYGAYIDLVNATLEENHGPTFPNSSEKLIKGALVQDLNELRNILAWSNDPKDSLWVMLGILPASDTTVADSTALIFALKRNKIVGNESTWHYFDFTRPCPASCPTW